MRRSRKQGSIGSVGCGCGLWLAVLAAWGILSAIFPKMPGYEETMERGEVVPGKVVRIETVENVTINDRNPRRVVFEYGEGRAGTMMMAMRESAREGQDLKVRVLGEQAYPQDIRPLAKPFWLRYVLIAGALFGALLIAGGVLRLLVIGGLLFAGGHALSKSKQSPPPPPPKPPV